MLFNCRNIAVLFTVFSTALFIMGCNNTTPKAVAPQSTTLSPQTSNQVADVEKSTFQPMSKAELVAKLGIGNLKNVGHSKTHSFLHSPTEENEPTYQVKGDRVEARYTIPKDDRNEAHINYWLTLWGDSGKIIQSNTSQESHMPNEIYNLRSEARGMTIVFDQPTGKVLKIFEYEAK